MDVSWKPPESWVKEGYAYAGVTYLKTGAWTTIMSAKESGGTHGTASVDVIIKMFSVPPGVHEDAQRIAKERQKFLDSAYLQKSLTDAGPQGNARAWVKILRIGEEAEHPCFVMEKCGPSVEDLFDHRVNMGGKDLYALVHAVVDGLIELQTRAKRSHGNLKISDVLSALPGGTPAFKLADPAAKGEDHSANDLYALGCIIYKMIEHKDWDPMTQILPTSHWDRFKVRRDRWIQFCNLLLSPNGCHEPLTQVKREAYRLKPVSSLRSVYIGLAGLALVAAGAGGYHVLMGRVTFKQPIVSTQTTADPTIKQSKMEIDPQVQAAFDAASGNYKTVLEKWRNLSQTQRYDHTQSRKLALASRAMLPDQVVLTDAASYQRAIEYYTKAAAKLQEAVDQEGVEEKAGQAQDGSVLADFQNAQKDYVAAKGSWDTAAGKFEAGTDHTKSKAIVDAAVLTKLPTPSDLAGFHSAADQYRLATEKINQALAMLPDEEKAGLEQADARGAFDSAKKHYQELKTKWEGMTVQPGLDMAEANAAADAAKKSLPEQFVLTDAASFRGAADQYGAASKKMEEAFGLVEKAKRNFVAQESDVSTAVAKANAALKAKKYPQAFSYYKQAAEMGNAPAMSNVGLFYEVGQGTDKDYVQAAAWYRKAADKKYAPAMVNLAFLYRNGKGVEKDFGAAFEWYKKGADGGSTEAMGQLASLYENGEGVDRDYDQALRWYKKAAAAGDATAMNNIGVFYEKGRGVPVDYQMAMQWYQKSAAAGNGAGMNDVGALYDNGHGVATDYVQAMEWYKKAAALNYAPAMCNIGTLYDNGQGTPVDHVEAMKWFRKAADQGHGMAMYNIGVLYETGRGVAVDMPEALVWYRKAARSNDGSAQQLAGERLDRLGYSH